MRSGLGKEAKPGDVILLECVQCQFPRTPSVRTHQTPRLQTITNSDCWLSPDKLSECDPGAGLSNLSVWMVVRVG
jgi:hypothetical protein